MYYIYYIFTVFYYLHGNQNQIKLLQLITTSCPLSQFTFAGKQRQPKTTDARGQKSETKPTVVYSQYLYLCTPVMLPPPPPPSVVHKYFGTSNSDAINSYCPAKNIPLWYSTGALLLATGTAALICLSHLSVPRTIIYLPSTKPASHNISSYLYPRLSRRP